MPKLAQFSLFLVANTNLLLLTMMNSKFFTPLLNSFNDVECPLRDGYLESMANYPSLHHRDAPNFEDFSTCTERRDTYVKAGLAVPSWLLLRIEALSLLTKAESLYKMSFRLEEAYHLASHPDEQRVEEEEIVDGTTGAPASIESYVAIPTRENSPSYQPTPIRRYLPSLLSHRVAAPKVVVMPTPPPSSPVVESKYFAWPSVPSTTTVDDPILISDAPESPFTEVLHSENDDESDVVELHTPLYGPPNPLVVHVKPCPDEEVDDGEHPNSNPEDDVEDFPPSPKSGIIGDAPTQHLSQLGYKGINDADDIDVNDDGDIFTHKDNGWVIAVSKAVSARAKSLKKSRVFHPYKR